MYYLYGEQAKSVEADPVHQVHSLFTIPPLLQVCVIALQVRDDSRIFMSNHPPLLKVVYGKGPVLANAERIISPFTASML